MTLSRRKVLKGIGSAALAAGLVQSSSAWADPEDGEGEAPPDQDEAPAPKKRARFDPGLGIMLDYSAGFPSPAAIAAGGFRGSMCYVSDQARGEDWMKAKPLTRAAADGMRAQGLLIASVWQWGGERTADWRRGHDAGVKAARRAVALHQAAGGPDHAAIYTCIDDNPPIEVWEECIADYLAGFEEVIGHERLGVFCSPPVINWCLEAGLGTYFWQHDWGNDSLEVHPSAHLHQYPGDRRFVQHIDGIECDVSSILTPAFGQW